MRERNGVCLLQVELLINIPNSQHSFFIVTNTNRLKMVYFPCVTSTKEVILVQVKLLEREQDGVNYIRLKDDDEEGKNGIEFGIRVDERLMNGKDAFASVNQAVSLTNNSGFLTVLGSIPKTINGASMGLAVAIECCRPGKYDNAFTGFVSNMNENDLTCRVHDIDNVTIKIKGCAKQKVPLVVPFSAEVAKLRRIVISPKDVCRGDVDTSLSTYSAYTMLEAICMANVIKSQNVSDAAGSFDSNAAQRLVNRGRALEIARRIRTSNDVPTRSNTPVPEDQSHRFGTLDSYYNPMFRDVMNERPSVDIQIPNNEVRDRETPIPVPENQPVIRVPADIPLDDEVRIERQLIADLNVWTAAQALGRGNRAVMLENHFAPFGNFTGANMGPFSAIHLWNAVYGTNKSVLERQLRSIYRHANRIHDGPVQVDPTRRTFEPVDTWTTPLRLAQAGGEFNKTRDHRVKEYMQTRAIKKYAQNPDPSLLGQQVVRPDEFHPHRLNKQHQIVRQMMLENMQAAGAAEARKRNRE